MPLFSLVRRVNLLLGTRLFVAVGNAHGFARCVLEILVSLPLIPVCEQYPGPG